VPQDICDIYGVKELKYGLDYIIPKPFDPRVLEWEAAAVAQAAMDTGVARKTLNIEQYKKDLRARMAASRKRVNAYVDTYDLS